MTLEQSQSRRLRLARLHPVSVVIAVIAFVLWFFVIEGPGPSLAPRQ